MAVGRLTDKWLLQVLQTTYPGGVLRRALLDHCATIMTSKNSSSGAKGRIARKLYTKLDLLQRRGLIAMGNGIIRPLSSPLAHQQQNWYCQLLKELREDEVPEHRLQSAVQRCRTKLHITLGMDQEAAERLADSEIQAATAENSAPLQSTSNSHALPLIGPILRKKQFLVLMVEDRNEDGANSPRLRAARWEFLASAAEAGWTVAQAARAIGITPQKASAIITNPSETRS